MASTTISPTTPSQLCSGKSGIFCPSQALVVKSSRRQMMGKSKGMRITCQATSIPADRVPDMGKRKLMNLLLLGAISFPVGGMLYPYTFFFVPPGYIKRTILIFQEAKEIVAISSSTQIINPTGKNYSAGSSAGGTVAKDAIGNDVIADNWLKTHGPGDRTLTQGLKGDPTYLVVEKDRTLATYAINAVCTHLGCVVPWNTAEKKFICPCHGSQYNDQGRVVRGPAPLSLALAHCDIDDGKVVFVPWVETDFRTGDAPWWA
ncbi:Cytochrome b6-f complex iron-sulfur subunit, chloroplastic [Mucuna pruriens]|uniref:plastoquinol--plastocyanin reductase n=1 Tax=Mucuna pruriens TaxID=157652 RepID=A0A371F4B2_MUCPR|nr:Cytochrome b6-f complex iron-sulfur subunit, chloroplastic [Mucuna pruriens]